MISRIKLLLTLSVLLTLNVQCSWLTMAEKPDSELAVVRFPAPWTKRTPDGSTVALADTRGLEVRKQAGSPGALLFRMKGLMMTSPEKSESVYSDEVFAVSLDNRFVVRSATIADWDRAEQLPSSRNQIRGSSSEPSAGPVTQEGLNYGGKLFRKSGDFWPGTAGLPSPNGKVLAVFSYSSTAKPARPLLPLSGSMPEEPRPGEMFVDVYDTSSGKRIRSGRAHYDSSPSIWFSTAEWAGDNYLVVPIDRLNSTDISGQACLLGILPTP